MLPRRRVKERSLCRSSTLPPIQCCLIFIYIPAVERYATREILTHRDVKSSETGVIESEIRLPCSHSVGSACIVTWLRTNNTCPLCRRVFFPAQTEPSHEGEDVPDEDGEDSNHEGEDEEEDMTSLREHIQRLSYMLCRNLRLSLDLSKIVSKISDYLGTMADFVDFRWDTPLFIIGATLHMVTHIMKEHRPLDLIARIVGVSLGWIREFHRRINPYREQLIRPNMLDVLSRGVIQHLPGSLPPPDAENDFMDHEEGVDRLEHCLIPTRLNQLEELCVQCSNELALSEDVRVLCSKIAGSIQAGHYLAGRSPLSIVAVSLYIASHLVSSGTTIRQISEISGISEGTIRRVYRRVYPKLGDFIFFSMIGENRRRRIVQELAWPAP